MSGICPDKTDVRILDVLQQEGRLSNVELAQRVGLSPAPCLRRVRHLEEVGLIRDYVALLEPCRIGLGVQAYVSVTMDKRDEPALSAFHDAMQGAPEVLSCHALTGDMDYLVHVVAEDMAHFSRFLMDRLVRLAGVTDVKTSFLLQPVKQTTVLPLAHLRRKSQ
ncbi:MAG: Lrp/AsnC family transcriptional regulator [Rhodocyclaceae bacterium]